MGKAHTCVLTKNGEVWTFGVNNKGQCGRDTGAMSQGGKGNDRLLISATVRYPRCSARELVIDGY